MRITSLTIALILIANFLQAQLNTSELNAYQNPDYKRTTLSNQFSAAINGLKNYGATYRPTLFHNRFKRNFQQDVSFSCGIEHGNKSYAYYSFLKYSQRNYLHKDVYISSAMDLNLYKGKESDQSDHHNYEMNPKIGLGFGRMEDITRPWLANNISKILNKYYGITELSKEALYRLADVITQARTQRKLDFREENIAETTMVVNEIKLLYPEVKFTIEQIIRLIDTYRYEAPRRRFNGFRSELNYSILHNSYFYEYQNMTTESKYWTHVPEFSNLYSRALSIAFQLDLEALLRYNKYITDGYKNYLYTSLKANLSYIPNARSVTTLSNSYYKALAHHGYITELDYNYYISPSLRLAIKSRYNFINFTDRDKKVYLDKDDRILVALQYIIF